MMPNSQFIRILFAAILACTAYLGGTAPTLANGPQVRVFPAIYRVEVPGAAVATTEIVDADTPRPGLSADDDIDLQPVSDKSAIDLVRWHGGWRGGVGYGWGGYRGWGGYGFRRPFYGPRFYRPYAYRPYFYRPYAYRPFVYGYPAYAGWGYGGFGAGTAFPGWGYATPFSYGDASFGSYVYGGGFGYPYAAGLFPRYGFGMGVRYW